MWRVRACGSITPARADPSQFLLTAAIGVDRPEFDPACSLGLLLALGARPGGVGASGRRAGAGVVAGAGLGSHGPVPVEGWAKAVVAHWVHVAGPAAYYWIICPGNGDVSIAWTGAVRITEGALWWR
jgi:hypothetical protein